jgi:nucleotide-binding universal stress UspA family protein
MGSVTERVMRRAPCPLLTVRRGSEPDAAPAALKTILCALDLSKHSELTLRHAVSLARVSNATLLAVHVVESDAMRDDPDTAASQLPFVVDFRRHVAERARTGLESLVPAAMGDVFGIERIVLVGTPHEEILRIATERHASLVVVGVRGARAGGLAFGSTAQHIVRGMECPVLTVRPI